MHLADDETAKELPRAVRERTVLLPVLFLISGPL